jgi:predicted phosphodiesterase
MRGPAFVALLSWLVAGGPVGCRDTQDSYPRLVVQPIATAGVSAGTLLLPGRTASVKFAVIGDSGRGTPPQYEIAGQMMAYRERFPFEFVLMLGDNIYEGRATPEDYRRKFEDPYRALLDENVKFYAVLGNHDDPGQVAYRLFNMHGERYYTFVPPEDLVTRIANRVEFFALDSTKLDRGQLRWLDERLAASRALWKICFFHHPLYTSGRYRLWSRGYRLVLEPLLVKHAVDVAFSGHEHIYQRAELQSGIQYFVSGGAGSLRPDDGVAASYVARTFSGDYHFMLVEIDGNELSFQAISRAGKTIDAGVLHKDAGEARKSHANLTRPDTAVLR